MALNNSVGSTGGIMPVPSPKLATSLGLRDETWKFPDEMQAAWAANGNQSATRNTPAIRSVMLEFWRQQRHLQGADLLQFVQARHPMLFASERAKVNGATNSSPTKFDVKVDGRVVARGVPQSMVSHYKNHLAPGLARTGQALTMTAANEVLAVSGCFATKFI